LIEVLVGIVIFALGMMALAQLQGSLSKASAEANARTVAINIAEEIVERLRTFSQVTASNSVDAFNNIRTPDTNPFPVQRGGIDYTVTQTVQDYYYNPDTGAFQTTKPDTRIVNPDLKRLELTVSWGGTGDAQQRFQIDASTSTSALGSGSVTLVDLISSFTTGSAAKVVLNGYGDSLYAPPVDYNPGENPDIISIQLGHNKFKESTTPLPDVIRADELVETRFDVVTYSQNDLGATFLRREEFRAVSCQCTLRIPDAEGEGGRRPTVWDGGEYTEGEYISNKPFGESASQIQSQFCDMCCRDHHDGGSGSNDDPYDPGRSLYRPFYGSAEYYGSEHGALAGDHKHYSRDRLGNMVLAAADGDLYLEACRMVRKDGFWRMAQDLRQEGLNAFPASYLDEESEVDEYSDYVTDAVQAYELAMGQYGQYELDPPLLTLPGNMNPPLLFPASSYDNASEMAVGVLTEQQLRARGIYIDYMSDVLREKINCLDVGLSGESCEAPDVTTALEIIPFYDVQVTWLARWNETPNNNPIDVTNQAVADDNQHSRGRALLQDGFGYSTITSAVHTGNLGLTATDPIDPNYQFDEEIYSLYALAVDYDSPPPLSGVIVSGSIVSSVPGVKAADVEIEASDAACDRTNTGFECVLYANATRPLMDVSNYQKAGLDLYACASGLLKLGAEKVSETGRNWTRFRLPSESTSSVVIVISVTPC
jgi:type II secretory pathway pseudopilin PulG